MLLFPPEYHTWSPSVYLAQSYELHCGELMVLYIVYRVTFIDWKKLTSPLIHCTAWYGWVEQVGWYRGELLWVPSWEWLLWLHLITIDKRNCCFWAFYGLLLCVCIHVHLPTYCRILSNKTLVYVGSRELIFINGTHTHTHKPSHSSSEPLARAENISCKSRRERY